MEFQNFARKIRSTFKQGAVMILYFLYVAIVLVSGEVPVTLAHSYETEKACEEVGNATAEALDADSDVKEYHLECKAITFDAQPHDSASEGHGGIALHTSAL